MIMVNLTAQGWVLCGRATAASATCLHCGVRRPSFVEFATLSHPYGDACPPTRLAIPGCDGKERSVSASSAQRLEKPRTWCISQNVVWGSAHTRADDERETEEADWGVHAHKHTKTTEQTHKHRKQVEDLVSTARKHALRTPTPVAGAALGQFSTRRPSQSKKGCKLKSSCVQGSSPSARSEDAT